MAHSLTPNRRTCDLDATALAFYPTKTNVLVLTTGTLPILLRTKDRLTKEAIPLRPKATIVDSLWLEYLAVRPGLNLLWRGQTQSHGLEIFETQVIPS